QARQDLARARLERVAAELLEARLRLAELLDQRLHFVEALGVGERVLELLQSFARFGDGARAGERRGEHAPALHLADVLREVADGRAAIDRDLPRVRVLLAHDHAEDGRLARAVRADEAVLLTLEDRARGVEEEDLLAVLLRDRVEPNHARALSTAG